MGVGAVAGQGGGWGGETPGEQRAPSLTAFFPSLGHDPASALIENYFLAEFLLSTVVK